jgi:large subunit ribosomal protein L6
LNLLKKLIINNLKNYKILHILRLELVGLGYKIKKRQNNLLLDLGFSHCVVYKLPKTIKVAIRKKKIYILGSNKSIFYKTIQELVNIKKINIYKVKGLKIYNKIYKTKIGKKKK